MEEFLSIDWHPPLEDIIDDVFIDEERMKSESVMYRILHGLFTNPFNEFETDNSEDEDEEDEIVNEAQGESKENKPEVQKPRDYVPGIVKTSIKFPRLSNLSREQQAVCLRVLLRFSGSEKPEMNATNRSELEIYMQLSSTIRKEQEEFLKVAKDNWTGAQLKMIGQEYADERWMSKVEKVRKVLPRYYVAAGNIPFNGDEKINLTAQATLLEMGQLPRVIVPTPNKTRRSLHCNLNKLSVLYPASSDSAMEKLTVSQDPNCERLAEDSEVDLVISSGGLNCLAANFGPNYTGSWILPIVVKETVKGNIVFVDKPLPPTAMTVPQKNAWVYKYILKSHLLQPNHCTSINLSDHEKQAVAEHELFGNLYSDDLLKLEEQDDQFQSCGAETKSDQLQTSERSIVSKKQISRDEGDIATLEMGDGLDLAVTETGLQLSTKFPTIPLHRDELGDSMRENNFNTEKVCVVPVPSEDTVMIPNVKTTSDHKENEETLDDEMSVDQSSIASNAPPALPSVQGNVSYKIFSLGPPPDAVNDSSKTRVEDYRILVRTRIDGVEKINKQMLHPVMLVPKLEHQVALGAEAVTTEEALKQWTMLTYRPDTSLVRIRISAENSEVIQIERRTPISINNEIKRLYSLNVEDSLVTLHNVVHYLKPLKPGKYLLRHTPTNGAFATIYQEADSSGKNLFDLHGTYAENSLQTIPNPPWPALDTVVITPSHKCFERMPAMYHPPRTDRDASFKVTRGCGRGGSRGRGRGRGTSGGGGRGGSQNPGRGSFRGGSRGGTRVRTKKAKKKKEGPKTMEEQQS